MGSLDLTSNLKQQARLYKNMLAISTRQLELARSEELEEGWLQEFLDLIGQRQGIMDSIDGLSAELPEGRVDPGAPGEHSQYRQLVAGIRETIGCICRNDEACQELIKKKLGRVADRMAGVRANKKAYRAYTGAGPDPAWFIDKKK